VDPDGALELLSEIQAVPEAPRRQILLEEAYYDHFGLKTQEEISHPLTGVLALQSEATFEYASQRQRIDEFIDLNIGQLGIDLQSFLALPREHVLHVLKRATAIKQRETQHLNGPPKPPKV